MSLYEYERNGEAQELIRILRESDNPRVRRRAASRGSTTNSSRWGSYRRTAFGATFA